MKTLAPWFPQHARPSATSTRTSWHSLSASPTAVQVMMTFRFHAGPFFSCDFLPFQTRLSNSSGIHPRHPSDRVQRRGPGERSRSSDTLPTQPLRTANNRFPEVHLKLRKFGGTMSKDRRNPTGSPVSPFWGTSSYDPWCNMWPCPPDHRPHFFLLIHHLLPP